jgi:hypothetical protein
MIVSLTLKGHGGVAMDVRPRRSSWLLRLAPWTRHAWVTLNGVVYTPDYVTEPVLHDATLAHEYVHVLQQRRLGWLLFALAYALGLPLPLGLALGRAWLEAEAYAHEVVHYGREFDSCVEALCSGLYGWPAPRWLVRRWMLRAIHSKEGAR